jgi:hypothetical protein
VLASFETGIVEEMTMNANLAEEGIKVWTRRVSLGKESFDYPGKSGMCAMRLVMRNLKSGGVGVVDVGPCDSPVIASGENWGIVGEKLAALGVKLK